ncbi:MAG: hypothetical protein ACK514_01015 [Bacteroidota bacterium]|jgi:hypothetical protein|nr:hypothetical protein [Cytophagales bacterium]MCE2958295.1 hypothetical protein [Flammeovirgaceae bacterium]MCZ8070960.1 hypothetical protein [Cytophagales bacterium]
METSITSYPESQSTIKIENVKPMSSRFQTIVNLSNADANGFVSFTIDENQMNMLFQQFHFKNHIDNLRNDYCIVAIRNLLKKNEFLQLSLQLSEKLITESEFETEIDQNPDKYIIQMNNIDDHVHLNVISNILTKIGKTFNVDEVSELFSIDARSINNELKAIGIK